MLRFQESNWMSYPGVNLLFADDFDHFRHRLGHPLIPFGLGHEEGVEHGDALAEHCDLQLFLFLEVIHELLQSHLLVTSRLHCVQLEPDEETLELCRKTSVAMRHYLSHRVHSVS